MDENRVKRNALLGQRMIKALESRNMEGYYAATKDEALKTAMDIIKEGSSVAWGGSMSIKEIGLKDVILSGDYQAYDRDSCKNAEEKRKVELATADCDYFLCSSNAITEDGILVNIDGFANRVAAISWGPRNVVMIVGMNKVVRTVDDAVSRARHEAAPINAQRFDVDTPCKKNGACFNCKSADCICCQVLITRFSKIPGRIKVILVDEALGF